MDFLILVMAKAIVICSTLFCLLLVLLALSFAVGWYGGRLWKRLRRTYHLTVIAYWLQRLEEEGTYCFQKPDDEN